MFAPEDPQAADEDGELRRGEAEQVRPVHQQVLRREAVALAEEVPEPVRARLERGERRDVGLLLAWRPSGPG